MFVSSEHLDTVIPRDLSTRPLRLATAPQRHSATAPRRANQRLGFDPGALIRMREVAAGNACRALAMGCPDREARTLDTYPDAVQTFGH